MSSGIGKNDGGIGPLPGQVPVPPDWDNVERNEFGRLIYTGEQFGNNPLRPHRDRGARPRRPYAPRGLRSSFLDRVDSIPLDVDIPVQKEPVPLSEEYTTALQEGNEEALAELRAGLEEYLEFLAYLRPAMLALAQKPVMTPESGHYQPRKSKKLTYIMHPEKAYTQSARTLAHPQRPVSDMVNEMVQELLSLPRFTSYAKIAEEVGGQQIVSTYKLNPDPLPQPDDETMVKMRKHKIRANTIRAGYYTERGNVKQAIKARQEKLRQREARKPQTTSDNDEE